MKKFTLLTMAAVVAISGSAINRLETTPMKSVQAQTARAINFNKQSRDNALTTVKSGARKASAKKVKQSEAYYDLPDGGLYYGYDFMEGGGIPILLLPAVTDVTFKNLSEDGDYSWTYTGEVVSTERDFTDFYYPGTEGGTYYAPTLTYNDETSYSMVAQTGQGPYDMGALHGGGKTLLFQDGLGDLDLGFCNVNPWCAADERVFSPFGYLLKNDIYTSSSELWAEALEIDDPSRVEFTGLCEEFAYPGRPYGLSFVTLLGFFNASKDIELKCTIYKITEDNLEELMTSTCKLKNQGSAEDTPGSLLHFDFVEDELTGEPLKIDGRILVVVDCSSDDITMFRPEIWGSNADLVEETGCHVYAKVDIDGEEQFFNMKWALYDFSKECYYKDGRIEASVMQIGVDYSFVEVLKLDDQGYLVGIASWDELYWQVDDEELFQEGDWGELNFILGMSKVSDLGSGEPWAEVLDTKTGEEVDWAEFEFLEDYADIDYDDVYSGFTMAGIRVKKPEASVQGRSACVKIHCGVSELCIYLLQGESGVKGVKVDGNEAKVVRSGDNFMLQGAEGAVVYNASGAVVGTTTTSNFNASDLASGMYIIRMNNGKAVKVVK